MILRIPETSVSHEVYIGIGLGSVVLCTTKNEGIRAIVIVRWPWSVPADIETRDGRKLYTRFYAADYRDCTLYPTVEAEAS